MNYREITNKDIKEIFHVRVSTDENNYSHDELENFGITEESVKDKLQATHKGWLCEVANKVVGFAIGDKTNGEMWVIAVLPEYIKKGIGAKLLELVENWLFEQGCSKLWLTTDVDKSLRAYSFYLKNGWQDDCIKDGVRYMKKLQV
jgi:ribosomal protein S18 acetylase RimI-like enzyme